MISINNLYTFLIILVICIHEVFSYKCIWRHIYERLYPDESNTKEIPLPTELMLFSDNPSEFKNSINHMCENNQIKDSTAASIKNSKKTKHSLKSEEKKKTLKPSNNKTQGEGYINIPFQPEKNSSTSELLSEVLISNKTFLQIFAAEIGVILILLFSMRYYALTRETFNDESLDISAGGVEDRRYSDEEIASDFREDDIALNTSSSMVYSHLQNVINQILKAKPEEEKYLTEDFLKKISVCIAGDGFMRSNFQTLLTEESLLQLGKFAYEINRKASQSEQTSSLSKSTDQQSLLHGTGSLQDVTVNLEVKVGDQEYKITT